MQYPCALLEGNMDRVIESVVRNVNAGKGAVPAIDAVEQTLEMADAAESRDTMADLCGHVAYALKSLDSTPHALATYRAPDPPQGTPTLNLVR